MKTHSMLANAATVRDILDGRQREDRRPVTPRTCETCGDWARLDLFGAWADPGLWQEGGDFVFGYLHAPQDDDYEGIFWRVYSRIAPGDLIWVKEAYAVLLTGEYVYRASWKTLAGSLDPRWVASVQMPRDAARLILRATKVWMERQGTAWLRCVAFEIASRSGWAGVEVNHG